MDVKPAEIDNDSDSVVYISDDSIQSIHEIITRTAFQNASIESIVIGTNSSSEDEEEEEDTDDDIKDDDVVLQEEKFTIKETVEEMEEEIVKEYEHKATQTCDNEFPTKASSRTAIADNTSEASATNTPGFSGAITSGSNQPTPTQSSVQLQQAADNFRDYVANLPNAEEEAVAQQPPEVPLEPVVVINNIPNDVEEQTAELEAVIDDHAGDNVEVVIQHIPADNIRAGENLNDEPHKNAENSVEVEFEHVPDGNNQNVNLRDDDVIEQIHVEDEHAGMINSANGENEENASSTPQQSKKRSSTALRMAKLRRKRQAESNPALRPLSKNKRRKQNNKQKMHNLIDTIEKVTRENVKLTSKGRDLERALAESQARNQEYQGQLNDKDQVIAEKNQQIAEFERIINEVAAFCSVCTTNVATRKLTGCPHLICCETCLPGLVRRAPVATRNEEGISCPKCRTLAFPIRVVV